MYPLGNEKSKALKVMGQKSYTLCTVGRKVKSCDHSAKQLSWFPKRGDEARGGEEEREGQMFKSGGQAVLVIKVRKAQRKKKERG